jgi:hypothetical protein
MDEVAQLDLSRISQSLKTKIEERLDSTKSIVTDFKTMIARYEKSMGKSTKRNATLSAPRKVHWAFNAAEDLSKFQPRLSAQLHMVQIVLQMGVWKFLNVTSPSDRLLAAPRQPQLLENGQFTSRQLPHMWNRGLLDQTQIQGLATQITDLVYRRLLTLPSVAMTSPGRAFTLPSGEATVMPLQPHPGTLPHENDVLGPSTVASPSRMVSRQNANNAFMPGHTVDSSSSAQYKPGTSLAGEINEHLHEFNLEGLSDAEMRSFDELALPPLLLESPEDILEREPEDNRHRNPNDAQPKSRRRFRSKFSAPGMDPLSALSIAGSVIQFVEFASKIATEATSLSRDINHVPIELRRFSRRVSQYSQLLTVVAQTIMGSMDDGGLHCLTEQVLSETQRAFLEAEIVLDRYRNRASRSRFAAATLSFTWKNDRNEISRVVDEIEALKPSLIIILQTLQMRAQSRTDAK